MQQRSPDFERRGELVLKRTAPVHGCFDLYGNRVPSERERQVIELVAQGLKNREVAATIGTTEHVVFTGPLTRQ